jgi:hypothetical protein
VRPADSRPGLQIDGSLIKASRFLFDVTPPGMAIEMDVPEKAVTVPIVPRAKPKWSEFDI